VQIAETLAPQPISNSIEKNPSDGPAAQEWEIDFDKSFNDLLMCLGNVAYSSG